MFKNLFKKNQSVLKEEDRTGLGTAPEWGPPSGEHGDCACMVDAEGKVSNIALHEQMEHGVDRTQITLDMRLRLADSLTPEQLDRYYPVPA